MRAPQMTAGTCSQMTRGQRSASRPPSTTNATNRKCSATMTSAPTRSLLGLNGREQLLEVLLLRGDRLGWPCQLEEHIAARPFHDSADQTITRDWLGSARHRTSHAGVGA